MATEFDQLLKRLRPYVLRWVAGAEGDPFASVAGSYITVDAEGGMATERQINPVGIAVGTDQGANTTYDVAVNLHLLAVEAAIAAGDFIAMIDITDNIQGKITFANLEAALTHDSLVAGTVASHDTGATGAELDTLTDGSDADALHVHATLLTIGAADWDTLWTDAVHSHANAGEGGTFDAANLTAGASNDGDVLTSDGGGGAAWEAVIAGAHDLLAASHGDTDPQAVTQGSIIIGDGTPEWTELVVGTAKAVLTNDGTDVAWSTGFLDIAVGKTLDIDNNLTLSGADGKALVLTTGLTVTTNDGTIAFGAAGKTLTINDSCVLAGTGTLTLTTNLTNQGANGVLAWTDAATLTIPAGGGTAVMVGDGGEGLYEAYMMCSDAKADTTNGGTFTKDAWRIRDINREDADTGGNMSIAGNQITLDAGTYKCYIMLPAFQVNTHEARLWNDTDGATELQGTQSQYCASTDAIANYAFIIGRFTIAAQKTFEIQHYGTATRADVGFGLSNADVNTTEVYTIAEFWKEA